MGCTQSKIENEEAVLRCKERKHFMKAAVSARNAFAAAHISYATFLKNTGAALSDFAHGEVQTSQLDPLTAPSGAPNSAPVVIQQPFEIPPPPPPPSNFPPPPLQRAASMPEMKLPKPESKPVGTIMEEDEENEIENEGSLNGSLRRRSSRNNRGARKEVEDEAARPPMPPPPSKPENPPPETNPMPQPQPSSAWEYFFPTMDNIPGTSLSGAEEVSLNKEEIERKAFDEKPKRVNDVDEELRSEKHEMPEPVPPPMPEKVVDPPGPPPPQAVVTAAPVKTLKKVVKQGPVSVEVKRPGKNVNLVQIFNDLDDHFLKASESTHEVSKMLEATRLHYHSNFADNRGHIDHSARVMRVITWNRSFRGQHFMDHGKNDFDDSEEQETHATVLDKLLAWEKKLYDEVKAGEIMKFDYQRKVATLNRLKKKDTNPEALEKAKAAVSHLHTRYIVDMQSMDSTVSEISRLRDDLLYPKLTQLVDGMAVMWKTMRDNHEEQSRIVVALRSLDISQSSKETSEHHYERTVQLNQVVQGWRSQFEMLVGHQKDYIRALNSWLKLNLIPIESSLKEKVSSPPKVISPPIQRFILAWLDHLERLPDELARTAITNFGALVETIMHLQTDEMQLKHRCEETRKDLTRKTKQFKDWHEKYLQRKIPDDFDPERPGGNYGPDEIVTEKKFVVEQLEKRLVDEEEAYKKHCLNVRQKSLVSFKNQLPELFRAMSDFAHQCYRMYSELSTLSHNLNSGQSLS